MGGAVQVQVGLKKFFIYFVISAVLGLFLHTILQERVNKVWGRLESRLIDKNIKGSTPQLVFSRSGWPVLGVRFQSGQYATSIKCYDVKAEVEDVFVPLPLFRILMQDYRVGSVDVQTMRLFIDQKTECLNVPAVSDGVTEDLVEMAEAEVAHAPEWLDIINKWFREREALSATFPVPQMNVRQIVVQGTGVNGKNLSAMGSASFSLDDELSVRLKFNPIEFKKKDRAISTNFTAEIFADKDKARFLGDWSYYEGHLKLDVTYDSSGAAKVDIATEELPLSFLNRWFDTDWSFQFVWFNCRMSLSADKATWAKTPWTVSNCKIGGNHGEVKVATEKIHSLKKPQNVLFQIYNFNLDQVLKAKESLPLTGVFKGFGILEGQAHIGHNEFSSELLLKNSQIVFSRRNKRQLQIIDEMKLAFSYKQGIYSLVLDKAKIQGGEFQGFFAVNYNKHLQRANSKIAVTKLSLSPEVQTLMWNGQFSPLSMVGELKMDEKLEIDSAKVDVGFKNYEASRLTTGPGTVMLEWGQGAGRLAFVISHLKVERAGEYPWFFATQLEHGLNTEVMSFSPINGQGHIEKDRLYFDKISTTSSGRRLTVDAEYFKGDMTGRWVWAVGAENLEWTWVYRNRGFIFSPTLEPMKAWLKLNDHFLNEHPYIQLVPPGA